MGHVLLHVEDDPQLRDIVRHAFASFGFRGEILTAGGVKEALALLSERVQKQQPLNMILVDMKLCDGLGLDIIREVKSDPYWYKTPVVALSGESSSQIINESYALGANCFFPKIPTNKNILDSLKKLYDCWLQGAVLPSDTTSRDTYATCLTRAILLRARTASYYAELAQASPDDPEMLEFWLDRSLNEGNFTNLIVFFQGVMKGHGFSTSSILRVSEMQSRVDVCLREAIQDLHDNPQLSNEAILGSVLDLHEAWDETCFFEIIKALLRQSPVAARAFQRLLVDHLTKIGDFISGRTTTPSFKSRCTALNDLARQIVVLEE